MDLLLGPFADARVGLLEGAELQRLEQLMGEEDTDLLTWLMGQEEPPDHIDRDLLAQLVAFRAANSTAR